MEKAFKYRIYPTEEQKILIDKSFGCARYVYNYFLAYKQSAYKDKGLSYSYYDLCKELTQLKKDLPWLKEPDKWALQNSLRDLDRAYKRFFDGAGYPKFKSKRFSKMSYRSSFSNNNIELLEGSVKLPKLGRVKIKDRTYRPKNGRILNATVSKTKTNKYFVSICFTDIEIDHLPKTGLSVGIDLGLKTFITTSDSVQVDNPRYLEKSEARLKKLQKSLSRKPKDSKNREKVRLKLAKCHEKIANQRKDFSHKLSKKLVTDYDVIVIEDLKVKNLQKNHYLAKSISSASWSMFTEMLRYKALFYGKTLVKIDPFFPSSQLCSNCGYKNIDVKNLQIRSWQCPSCGSVNDRDVNAAKNILSEGLRLLAS